MHYKFFSYFSDITSKQTLFSSDYAHYTASDGISFDCDEQRDVLIASGLGDAQIQTETKQA